jgi:tRNA (guanine-N7-)-methyltransferase
MGRRALPKLDPAIELAHHLRTVEQLPQPWETGALFANGAAPLEIEVGSGKGLFLQSAASAAPDHNFLGIEVARKYAHHTASRLAKRNLTNAVIVAGDALRAFREILPDGVADAVHVYFPDPWWKKRHRKRRVMNEAFLKDVVRTLKPGGRFHFWTDVEEYFQSGIALVAEHTPLVGPLEVAERAPEHDLDFRTHFERRMRLAELPVYRSEFRKKS